jgi:hypothetical protein
VQLRTSLREKEEECYEAKRKAELGLEEIDKLRSEQKIDLARQNKELEALKLEAEHRVTVCHSIKPACQPARASEAAGAI